MPFCERSYAHCSMYSYVHPRTFTCACVSNLMEGSARSNLRNILCITQICKWISTLDATLHYLRQFEQVQHVTCTLWIRSLEWEFMTEKRRVDVDDSYPAVDTCTRSPGTECDSYPAWASSSSSSESVGEVICVKYTFHTHRTFFHLWSRSERGGFNNGTCSTH